MHMSCVSLCFPCSPAVIVVRGAGSPPLAASPEEQAERAAGKSPHAAQHEQHEAWAHTQVGEICDTGHLTINHISKVVTRFAFAQKRKQKSLVFIQNLWRIYSNLVTMCQKVISQKVSIVLRTVRIAMSGVEGIRGGGTNQQRCEVMFLENIVCSCLSSSKKSWS